MVRDMGGLTLGARRVFPGPAVEPAYRESCDEWVILSRAEHGPFVEVISCRLRGPWNTLQDAQDGHLLDFLGCDKGCMPMRIKHA